MTAPCDRCGAEIDFANGPVATRCSACEALNLPPSETFASSAPREAPSRPEGNAVTNVLVMAAFIIGWWVAYEVLRAGSKAQGTVMVSFFLGGAISFGLLAVVGIVAWIARAVIRRW